MPGGLGLDRKRQIAAPNSRQKFFACLDRTFGPAMLLRFETVHVDRQLGGRNDVGQKDKLPTGELGAVTQVEIFAKGVVLPATGFLNARFSPQTCGAIEIEKAPTS